MGPLSNTAARSVADKKPGELPVNRYAALSPPREDWHPFREGPAMRPSFRPALAQGEPALTLPGTRTSFSTPVGGAVKRAFDMTIAATTLALMAPTMVLIALLIYCTMGGPVFYVQQRVGFNRRQFGCLKFRTMVVNADEKLADYLARNPEADRLWRETQKLKDDPRVTWLGQILRKSSLDELPQLFNVLRGDMSCIGPRPVLLDELSRYGEYQAEYARAKPGLTGMWQVSGRSNTSYAHRVNCDRYYVRRWSLLLDLRILFRTMPAVLKFDQTG